MLHKEKKVGAVGHPGKVLQRFFNRMDLVRKTEPGRCHAELFRIFANEELSQEIQRAIHEISMQPYFNKLLAADRRDFKTIWRRLLAAGTAPDETFLPVAKALRGFVQ